MEKVIARVSLAAAACCCAAASAQVVDINAGAHCTAAGGFIEVALEAGVYRATPVGPPGGAFTAYNVWGGSVVGCNPSGGECTRGWQHRFRVETDAGELLTEVPRVGLWSTAEQALATALPRHLRICETGVYRFMVRDEPCSDNLGGVSIRLDPEPCPADLNLDGALDFFDFLEFQDLFAAGDPLADFDCSGELDFFDFLAFQNAFAAGC